MDDEDTEYLLVTEYFHPDTASTGQLMTDLAVGLRERGLDLKVYTGQPNYHSGANDRQPTNTTHRGVPVHRIRAPQTRQVSMPRRLVNWAVFTVWMTLRLLLEPADGDRELVFVTCPPFLPVAMWLVCTIRGWEYTYIAYDLYPDEPAELDLITKGGIVHRVWEHLDRRAFRGAANVVTLGPTMRRRVSEKLGPAGDPDKIQIIHNWADPEFITPSEKTDNWFSAAHDLVDTFVVLYSGNIAKFHDLETVVRAAAELADEDVRFLIIGEGDNKARIVSLAEELGVRGDTVRFLPYQDYADLPYSLTAGDVSVVAVKRGFEGIVVSSKLYTAMAAGQPVLVIAQPHDDEARIVNRFDAGVSVEQGAVTEVVNAVERWRADPALVEQQGRNARSAFETHFVEEQAIDAYFRMLTAPDGVPLEAVR